MIVCGRTVYHLSFRVPCCPGFQCVGRAGDGRGQGTPAFEHNRLVRGTDRSIAIVRRGVVAFPSSRDAFERDKANFTR